MNKRQLGSEFEQQAAEYLKQKGYKILEFNFRNRFGEIDIVAKEQEYLCFVEVKYRKENNCGYASEAVDYRKQQNILRVANYYLMKNKLSEWTPCRFDVVAMDGDRIELIQNAWEL